MNLILLPGLDGTGLLFTRLISFLDHCFTPQVISFPQERYLSYEELEEYVINQIPSHEQFFLFAESFSGPLALMIAKRCAPLVKGVILSSTFAVNPAPNLGVLIRSFKNFPFPAKFLPSVLLRFFFLGWDSPPETLAVLRAAVQRVDAKVLTQRLHAITQVDKRSELRSCSVPLIYLRGTHDKLVGKKSLDELLQERRDMRVVEIEAEHALSLIRPREVAAHIKRFSETVRESEIS